MRQFLGMIAVSLMAGYATAAASAGSAAGAEAVPVSQLKEHTHIHGLAVDRQDPEKLLIATHHGLFRSGPDGKAELISPVQDFMGFTPDPSDPKTLYASGHPAGGGNLGFIASTDNGVTWEQVAPGADGPVDFHKIYKTRMAADLQDPDGCFRKGPERRRHHSGPVLHLSYIKSRWPEDLRRRHDELNRVYERRASSAK